MKDSAGPVAHHWGFPTEPKGPDRYVRRHVLRQRGLNAPLIYVLAPGAVFISKHHLIPGHLRELNQFGRKGGLLFLGAIAEVVVRRKKLKAE